MSEPIRIALYNHKGGVGKTTLTVNIGAALAYAGKRVLLVDSDPQCNLTAYFFDDESVNALLDGSEKPNGRTIWTAVKPIDDGVGDVSVIRPSDTVVSDVLLVPGDIRMSKFEQTLADSWTDCFKRKLSGFRAVTAISSLVSRICQAYKIDIVMYDAGPNIGPLNRALLLDCDYFIVPIACDLFSVRALTTLGQSLKSWIKDWETIAALAPDSTYLLRGRPRFIGYIPQRFKTYGRTMAKSPQYYLGKVQKQIHSDVINVLKDVSSDLVPAAGVDPRLGSVKEFGSLVQIAQREGVPLAIASDGDDGQKAEAATAFAEIAARILAIKPVSKAAKSRAAK